jgi:hypothetical protein
MYLDIISNEKTNYQWFLSVDTNASSHLGMFCTSKQPINIKSSSFVPFSSGAIYFSISLRNWSLTAESHQTTADILLSYNREGHDWALSNLLGLQTSWNVSMPTGVCYRLRC